MAAPLTSDAFMELVRKSGLIEQNRLDRYCELLSAGSEFSSEPKDLAKLLVNAGFLTYFQATQLMKGKYRGFTVGKYKILERLGSGSNSSVFLCEHVSMRRKVALKILPLAKAEDPGSLARFYREARAAGQLDHPNIIDTYDNGQEGDLHFLVMEYVDGSSLQEIVQKHGPMNLARAASYIRQAAIGLLHIHQAGLIHRDIKPANVLLERRGIVKILDLGLARFFHDHKDTLTQQYNQTSILGTADYLSPEQALNSHDVDTRTDIYSLGATLYFLLAARPPFEAKAVSQKLLCHLTKEPTPLRELRPEVPEALIAIVQKMMAKDREQRYQSPAAVVRALTPWAENPIAPPPVHEMPQISPAAQRAGLVQSSPLRPDAAPTTRSTLPPRKEKMSYSSSAAFGRHSAYAGVLTSAESGQAVDRSASKPPKVFRSKQLASNLEASTPAPPAKPLPDKGQRGLGLRQAADTLNAISRIHPRPDLLEGSWCRASSRQPILARSKVWQREKLRKLAVICLVAAVAGGIALHLLFSRAAASFDRQKRFPQATSELAPDPMMNLRDDSGEER